jgi:hypothetical protein
MDLLSYIASEGELNMYVKLLTIRTKTLVEHYWPVITEFAGVLLERGRIKGREAERIIVELALKHGCRAPSPRFPRRRARPLKSAQA